MQRKWRNKESKETSWKASKEGWFHVSRTFALLETVWPWTSAFSRLVPESPWNLNDKNRLFYLQLSITTDSEQESARWKPPLRWPMHFSRGIGMEEEMLSLCMQPHSGCSPAVMPFSAVGLLPALPAASLERTLWSGWFAVHTRLWRTLIDIPWATLSSCQREGPGPWGLCVEDIKLY